MGSKPSLAKLRGEGTCLVIELHAADELRGHLENDVAGAGLEGRRRVRRAPVGARLAPPGRRLAVPEVEELVQARDELRRLLAVREMAGAV